MSEATPTPEPEPSELAAAYRLGQLRRRCKDELETHMRAVALNGSVDKLTEYLRTLQRIRPIRHPDVL